MKKCEICNDKPNEIFIGFLAKQGLKIVSLVCLNI